MFSFDCVKSLCKVWTDKNLTKKLCLASSDQCDLYLLIVLCLSIVFIHCIGCTYLLFELYHMCSRHSFNLIHVCSPKDLLLFQKFKKNTLWLNFLTLLIPNLLNKSTQTGLGLVVVGQTESDSDFCWLCLSPFLGIALSVCLDFDKKITINQLTPSPSYLKHCLNIKDNWYA